MLRQGLSDGGDGIHELTADPLSFLLYGTVRPESDGRSEAAFFQPRGDVHRHEGQLSAGFFVVEPSHIHEFILKIPDDVVVGRVMLREDHDAASLLQELHGIFEGGEDAGVVINAYGAGVVEHAYRKGRDDIGQSLEEGS